MAANRRFLPEAGAQKGVNTMVAGWEWIVILVVVLLVFGVGRISKIGSELGQGIKNFRQGVREGMQDEKDEKGEPVKTETVEKKE
jgi:sec-independent protein translocase protein TatA